MSYIFEKKNKFILTEFPASNLTINVNALFELSKNGIDLTYTVTGNLSNIKLPFYKKEKRENNLWEKSCFEFFLAEKKTTEYMEFNFSPSGKWNVYTFDSHRENMKEDYKVKNVAIHTERGKNNFTLAVHIDLYLTKFTSNYEFQLAAILKTKDGTRRFFAIDNSPEQPDFHNRKFFVNL